MEAFRIRNVVFCSITHPPSFEKTCGWFLVFWLLLFYRFWCFVVVCIINSIIIKKELLLFFVCFGHVFCFVLFLVGWAVGFFFFSFFSCILLRLVAPVVYC